jgi:RecQ-mediated genome instability protein 1
MVLKDVTAARGLLLLTPGNTTFLGGKIEVLNLAWVEGRRQALQSAIEQLRS